MKLIITGSSGMVGKLVLTNCLNSDKVTEVISLVRKSTGQRHNKLSEIVITNFEDYSNKESLFRGISVAFFCLGVYTGQVPDDLFKKITVRYAVEFAVSVRPSTRQDLCLGFHTLGSSSSRRLMGWSSILSRTSESHS